MLQARASRTIVAVIVRVVVAFAVLLAVGVIVGTSMHSPFAEYLKLDVLTGRVVDHASGVGIPDAEVSLRTTGWDPLRGGLGQRETRATTDEFGAFHIRYRRLISGGSKAFVVARDYAPMFLEPIVTDTLRIPLGLLANDADQVTSTILNPAFTGRARAAHLDLLRTRETSLDSADVTISVAVDIQPQVIVTAHGQGGVIRRDLLSSPPVDWAALECRAPTNGYRAADTLRTPSARVLYYLRDRTGRAYARLVLDPNLIVRAAESSWTSGPGVVLWVNLGGGTGLCGPDPVLDAFLGNTGGATRSRIRGSVRTQ